MTSKSIDTEAVPIVEIYRLRNELADAVDREKWKTAKNRAKAILKILPLAVHKDPRISKVGSIHLDGVYNIGWQLLGNAPKETKEIIERMNNEIRKAKLKIPKKKKKKK